MSDRVIMPGLAGLLSVILLLAALGSPVALYFTLGPAPCQDESWFYDLTRLAIPVSLIAGAILIYRLRHRSGLSGLLAPLVVPAVAIGLNSLAARTDAARQADCSRRGLRDAITYCAAKSAHYREGRDQYGYSTLTLVAPGTTDESWNCLNNWATHNGSVSMNIDQGVYEHYRRVHRRP